jgi:hypothetical protein
MGVATSTGKSASKAGRHERDSTMTASRRIGFGSIGLMLGALALLLAIAQVWVAAAAPAPRMEDRIADKVVAIRDAAIDRWTERAPKSRPRGWDRERLVIAATSVLGGVAVVCAAFGFVRREPLRTCATAAVLGIAAIAFPLVIGFIGAVIVLFALAAVVGAVVS